MIYEIQRAHSRLQYALLILPILIAGACLYGITQTYDSFFSWVCFVFFFTGSVLLTFNILRFKQILYDNSHIYIKSFFGKSEATITYYDVVELKDKEIPFWRKQQQRSPIRLTYRTAKGLITVKFNRSFYERQIDLLKRQISPEKVIE